MVVSTVSAPMSPSIDDGGNVEIMNTTDHYQLCGHSQAFIDRQSSRSSRWLDFWLLVEFTKLMVLTNARRHDAHEDWLKLAAERRVKVQWTIHMHSSVPSIGQVVVRQLPRSRLLVL